MKVKLEIEKELITKVETITATDYLEEDKSITVDGIESIIKDMIHEYNTLKEKYDDLERDLEENYTRKKDDCYEDSWFG